MSREDDYIQRMWLDKEQLRMMERMKGRIIVEPQWFTWNEATTNTVKESKPDTSQILTQAKEKITELEGVLERIQKDALILQAIDRISKDGKHAYVKKGNIDLRIEAVKDLAVGDEVLLHPKTMQIVERLGRPPLQVSPFAVDNVTSVSWDDIGGLEDAKADLIEAVEMPHKHRELFAFYGNKQIKGILLSGPPGCGKTMLGKAAANSLAQSYGKEKARTGFLYVKGPEILNKYVGESEQTIRNLFFDAKRHREEHGYPAVIFLDEADSILAARGTRNVGIGNTIVPMFLTEMDGLEESSAIVIIATNMPETLDPAVVRDGRVDRRVTVTRPNVTNAVEILHMSLKKVPLAKGLKADSVAREMAESIYHHDRFISKGVRLNEIVNGAMLVNVINLAVSAAMRRDMRQKTPKGLTEDDCKSAIDRLQQQSAAIAHSFAV